MKKSLKLYLLLPVVVFNTGFISKDFGKEIQKKVGRPGSVLIYTKHVRKMIVSSL